MRELLTSWDDRHAIDLILANAGVDGSAYSGAEVYYNVIEINLIGVLNTVLPLLPAMRTRGRGQLALFSSMAGFRGLASAVAYATSKNAVKALAEGLRGRHAGDGIQVSVICPGFVESRITASNKFPMPFIWPADKAARHIAAKLRRNKGRIAFPWPMHAGVWVLAAMPPSWADALITRAPRKQL
jgi:short-subunit dehydrogenase